MRKNFVQAGTKGKNERTFIESDWFAHGIPANVVLSDNVYIDTSYGFAAFLSERKKGLFIGEASGCYDRATFVVSPMGEVTIGQYCILNGCTIVCNQRITIGNNCMLAWGSVVTDTWLDNFCSVAARSEVLTSLSGDHLRPYPMCGQALPVVLEDNCWVGFGAVILPGVTLGRGCVVGSKTIISENVPPYAIVVGHPPRIVKFLDPDDIEEVKTQLVNKAV